MISKFAEKAAQMAIMDAIENGHTDKDELIAFMASVEFETSVKKYIEMMEAEFWYQPNPHLTNAGFYFKNINFILYTFQYLIYIDLNS